MRKLLSFVFPALLIAGCGGSGPDVSGIEASVGIARFEKDFFAVDTINTSESLETVKQRHPRFYPDFMQNILEVSGEPTDTTTVTITRIMLKSYRPVYDTINKVYPELDWLEEELEDGFRHVRYYFTNYTVPEVKSYVGLFSAPGVAFGNNYIAIGLHQFVGRDYSAYKDPEIMQIYPQYITRRFSREYITPRVFEAVVQDLYADRSAGRPLIEQFIEKGKQWWLLDKFLPDAPDSVKTGFTQKQLEWCAENEGLAWNYIITNENLYSIDPVIIQTYIGEAPFTQGMPNSSPGNIGQWIGWQIVKKFAAANEEMTVQQIMEAPARKILDESGYKPR